MDGESAIRAFFEERLRFCRNRHRHYRRWLNCLSPLKWVTVGGSVILSSAASITILGTPEAFGDNWQLWSAIMSAAAGALAALHSNLRCDSYQAECLRIINMYQAIEFAYEAARTCDASELAARRDKIEERIESLIENAGA